MSAARTANEETDRTPGRWRTVLKWVILAVLMGVISGLAAALLVSAVAWATSALQGGLVGYRPATTNGDGAVHAASALGRPWVLPLVTAGGALAASLIILALKAPETSGHGTDAAIAAARENPAGVRSRVATVKTVTASLTIGSGGSGGTEGPITQIAGALGSWLSRRAELNVQEARTLYMAGLGSGIGAIFRSPLSGGLLAAELLYRRGLALGILLPGALASAAAYGSFGAVHGFGSMFGDLWLEVIPSPHDVPVYAVLGLTCGMAGRLYCRSFYGVSALTERLIRRSPGRRALPAWAPPALGGLAVGFLGMAVPEVLGPGFGTIQHLLSPHAVRQMSLWLVLLLPLAKIAATSLSIGTGGPGGVFGPGLLIGAATGVAIWRVFSPLGIAPEGPLVFAIIGMAACLGAIIHAPLGVTILVLESTRSPGLFLPTAVAMAASCWLVGDQTLYRSQDLADGYRIIDPLRALCSALRRVLVRRRGRVRTAETMADGVPADVAEARSASTVPLVLQDAAAIQDPAADEYRGDAPGRTPRRDGEVMAHGRRGRYGPPG